MALISFVGRLLFVMIFFGSALDKFSSYEKTTGGPTAVHMAPKLDEFLANVHTTTGIQIPIARVHYPTLILVAAAQEAIGGLLFLLNFKLGSIVLLSFMIPTSFIMHNFWDAPNEQVGMMEMIQFMKNLAIMGALVMHLGQSRSSRAGGKTKRD